MLDKFIPGQCTLNRQENLIQNGKPAVQSSVYIITRYTNRYRTTHNLYEPLTLSNLETNIKVNYIYYYI